MKEKIDKKETKKIGGVKKKTGVLHSQKASAKNRQAGKPNNTASSKKNIAAKDFPQSVGEDEKTSKLSGINANEENTESNGGGAGEKTAKLNGADAAESVKESWLKAVDKLPSDCTEELLNAVANSARASKTVIGLVLPQVGDEKLKTALTEESAAYDDFLDKVKHLAKSTKAEIKEPNPIGKFISNSGVRFKLFFNSDTTDIAELLITEKTSEVIELGREVKQLSPVSSESRLIAADLLKFHEAQINDMKYYL